jgi:hypothetical protein
MRVCELVSPTSREEVNDFAIGQVRSLQAIPNCRISVGCHLELHVATTFYQRRPFCHISNNMFFYAA